MDIKTLVKNKKIIFWDFDGVIKESVEVKNDIFVLLFKEFGDSVIEKIKEHHLSNGGMSRHEKFPIYLNWAGLNSSQDLIFKLNDQFNKLAVEGVINSSWVPGVESFLKNNAYNQEFILVSATPINELHTIINNLRINNCFKHIFGYPDNKIEVIRDYLKQSNLKLNDYLMIGDSVIDFEAAIKNKIDFLLRKRNGFKNSFKNYDGYQIENFNDL